MTTPPMVTIGIDLGDRNSVLCVLDAAGTVQERQVCPTTRGGFTVALQSRPPARVIVEVGPHSPWVSRLLRDFGHEVIVANARRIPLITTATRKSDPVDAEMLARLGRVDPALLAPIHHRSEAAHLALAELRARDALVRARTQLINHVRGTVKAFGEQLPAAPACSFHRHAAARLSPLLQPVVASVLAALATLSEQIRGAERRLGALAREHFPEAMHLQQVPGVGPVTALAFVLTLEDPHRFATSRSVGAYLGLCSRRDQSSGRDPQLRISKAGDPFVRRLLVTAAQYILGPFGPDTDLRRWGLQLAAQGGKYAKRRAVVALARKLATILHHLWITGATYRPLRLAGDTHVAA